MAIRIAVNFDCLIQFSCNTEYAFSISFETKAIVVNSPAWVAKDLNIRVSQGSNVALGLVILLA
jgi:hypothetical protein